MSSATTSRRQGLTGDKGFKAPVRAGTTTNITLSGEQTVDGVAVKAVGTTGYPDRVLVKNQTNPVENGIYDVSTAAWTRSLDANGTQDLVTGTGLTITEGGQALQYLFITTTGAIIPGSTSMAWAAGNPGLTALAASTGSSIVGHIASGAGAVDTNLQQKARETVSVYSTMTAAQIADVQSGALTLDVTVPVQQALTNLVSGQELIFPGKAYKITNYLTLTSVSNFKLIMDGVIVPSASLGNVNTALFFLTSCTDFTIIPNVVNATYTSTLNVFRLNACARGRITLGKIDVKYNSYDGTAAICIGANTTNIRIAGNFIRSGYGVLQPDTGGVSGIEIESNDFYGQKLYGSTGQGDAVEFNGPTNSATEITVNRNRFSGYQVHNPGGGDARIIVVGMANVTGFSIDGNTFDDCESENIHIEDGTSKGTINGNRTNGGVMGINIAPNSNRDLTDIVVMGNSINQVAQNGVFATDYGAAILCNVNSAFAGRVVNLTIVGNKCAGNNLAQRGIVLYDVNGFTLADNVARDFPRSGFDVRKFAGLGTGPQNGVIKGNNALACGWNYILGGLAGAGPLTNIYFDESNQSSGSLFGLDYNVNISTRVGCTIRIPYASGAANRLLSVGDLVVFNDGRSVPVITAGVAGAWKAADGEILWSKPGSGASAVVTVTFASYASANITSVVEVIATGAQAGAASFGTTVARFQLLHSTTVSNNDAFGTNDAINSGGAVTITPSVSGLGAIFTCAFPSGFTNCVSVRITQSNIHDQTLGGVASIA